MMPETEIETVDIDGELLATSDAEDLASAKVSSVAVRPEKTKPSNQRFAIRYLVLPFAFLTIAMLGGLRLAGSDASFIFVKPALLCLIFAAIMMALLFRSGLVRLDGWFAEDFSLLKNAANCGVLIAFFAATTQLFNSLIPEQGLPFWIVSFCFFWTLWNNLFAEFDTKRLLRSLGALFGLAFVVKYLVLANLTAPSGESWLRSIVENPAQEAFTWLLNLPRFSPATGYIQFFVAAFYLVALYLFPASTRDTEGHSA